MLTTIKTIKKFSLLQKGDVVGVAVSGGSDSMSLLSFLNANKDRYQIEIMAINIDHQMRKDSYKDSNFVNKYCKENNINFKKFKVDALKLATEQKLTKEEAARNLRYGVFDALLKNGVVSKIALGHHMSDQAETILLNLFRGTGLSGAKGMEIKRDNYIRPMLYTSKLEIENYIKQKKIKFITDESNLDSEFSRNYLRNEIMPLLRKRWKGVESNLVNFGQIAKADDDYILSIMNIDAILKENYLVKIPISYFLYKEPIVNRMLKHCFKHLGVEKDIERKHLSIIKNMVKEAANGIKINLPNKITIHKEYDYITIISKAKKYGFARRALKSGTIKLENFGTITIKRTYKIDPLTKDHIVDVKKIPKGSIWRTREEGDTFTKFGGGTKKLKDFFIDKKIPKRIREGVPVLAIGNEVLIIAGFGISDKIKVDENTKSAYVLTYDIKL